MLLISHQQMLDHQPGSWHPEQPARLGTLLAALAEAEAEWRQPAPATRAQLGRVHTEAHLERLDSLRGCTGALDPDTFVSPGSVRAAYLAAGAAVEAARAVVAGSPHRQAFALVRPPGHHAEPGAAMGFCLLNSIAVAAAHALAELGRERVLIVDWDVHHGNGTQRAFYGRRDVLYFSLHQHPFYPGTGRAEELGEGAGEGYTVNLPLPAGCGDADYVHCFRELLIPLCERYRPELCLVSAGFDAHRDDPIGGMQLSAEGYAALMGLLQQIAAATAGGRIALVLEGGYDLPALAQSARACLDVLGGATPPSVPGAAGAAAVSLVERTNLRLRRLHRL